MDVENTRQAVVLHAFISILESVNRLSFVLSILSIISILNRTVYMGVPMHRLADVMTWGYPTPGPQT